MGLGEYRGTWRRGACNVAQDDASRGAEAEARCVRMGTASE